MLPAAVATVLFAGLTTYGLNFYADVRPAYDLGYFSQAAWLIQNGEPPLVTVRGLHLLGDHTYYLFYPLALLIAPFPTAEALLVVQALALSLAVFPLAGFARKVAGLGEGSTAAVLGAYAFYPAVQNLNAVEFHPETLAVPLLLGALLFAGTRRWSAYAGCVAAVLLSREDLAITVTTLGLVLVVSSSVGSGAGHRTGTADSCTGSCTGSGTSSGGRRAGAWTAAAGVLAWLVNTYVVLPHFSGTYVQAERMSGLGDGAGGVALHVLTNPITTAGDLLTGEALGAWLALLGPLLFLPLLGPRWLLPALPLHALVLLSDRPTAEVIERQYVAQAIPFFLAAAAVGLARVQSVQSRRAVPWLAPALVLAPALSWVVWSTSSPLAAPGWERPDVTDRALVEAVELVPDGVAVAGTERTWPRLAERTDLYNFPAPFEGFDPPRDDRSLADRRSELRWVVLDPREGIDHGLRAEWLAQLRSEGWRTTYDREGVLVLTRDPP